jgi:hypothetical protein
MTTATRRAAAPLLTLVATLATSAFLSGAASASTSARASNGHSTAASWSIQTTPNRHGTNFDALAERWNGSTWTIQHTPNPAGATLSLLLGVSCPSATGRGLPDQLRRQKTLAERYGT